MEVNREAILSGLPLVGGRLNPALLLRAAHRAGFRAQMVERSIRRLPRSVLPAIVLLDQNRAGVLLPGKAGAVELHVPGAGSTEPTERTWKRAYSGFAVLLQPHASDAEEIRPGAKWWFWQTMWRFRAYYVQLMPAAFLLSVLGMVMPIFTLLVYDRVVPHDASETLWVLALGISAVFVFDYLLRLLRGSVLSRAGREVDMVLASALYEQLVSLEMQARPSSPSVLAARIKAYEILRDFFMSATMLAIVDLPFCLLMMAALFYIAGPIAWIVVASAIGAVLMGFLFQMPLRRSVVQSSEAGLERQAMVSETVNALESVKGANAEGALQHRFEGIVGAAAEKDVGMHWYSLLGNSTTTTIINMTNVAVVVAGVYRVHAGEMTMGGMIASLMLSSRTMMPIAMIAGMMTRLQQALQALQSLNTVMALPRETGGHRKFVQRSSFDFNYALDNVTVRYPGQMIPALNGVSLRINQGQRIGLVGRMGSGKSTVLRLLAKLYSPTDGKILLDGVDLAQYHPAVVRHDIGYLAQDAAVLSGTIRENVALGERGVTDEEILRAIRLAGLEDFVKRNPKGIHAPVGEQGTMLSGGQRRALVLARAFLRLPRLLLLDEPISNMDPQSEKEFIHALKNYLEQDPRRTLIVVTHQSSMLQLAEHMIVLNEGRVFMSGEKSEVLAKLAGTAHPHPNPNSSVHTEPTVAAPPPARSTLRVHQAAPPKITTRR
ncbi:ATP-binding cassette subfamily C protein LapB [Chthoniobacter flavus]|nr:ATP-binding cassette subfamily C protein LapB [Chthoniobacter flavus]